MIRKKKLYSRPMKRYEKGRIEDENKLTKRYGLKSKREIWKAQSKIDYFRKRAMALARLSLEEREVFFKKLQNLGLKVNQLADILGLKVEDLLDRRLSTVIVKKGLANTPKQARQMIVHKRILVNEKVVNAPSYVVSVDEEGSISVKIKKQTGNAKGEGRLETEKVEGRKTEVGGSEEQKVQEVIVNG